MMLTTVTVDMAPSLVRDPRAPISDTTVIAIASTGSTIVDLGLQRRHGNHGMITAMAMAATPAATMGAIEVPPERNRSWLSTVPRTVSGSRERERTGGVPRGLLRIVCPTHSSGIDVVPVELTHFSRSGSDAPSRTGQYAGGVLVEVYSDIVCPWCYIGQHQFGLALERSPRAADLDVQFRAFQLDPRARNEPTPVWDAYVGKFGGEDAAAAVIARITGAAAAVGLELRLDRALRVNTFDAHRLVWLAGARARQWEVERRLLEAYLVEGRNVADATTLVAIAEEAGLDPVDVESELAAGAGTAEVRGGARVRTRARRARRPHLLLRESGGSAGRAGSGHVRADHRPRGQSSRRELVNRPRSMSRWSDTSPICSTPISRSANHHSTSCRAKRSR